MAQMVAELGKGKVLQVGFFEGAKYPDTTPIAQVALWNEYGTVTSPPRPFMRATIDTKGPEWPKAMASIMRANPNGQYIMEQMGEGIQGQLVQTIITWSDPPNAPSTIAAKGFDAPLRDTMLMSRSVGWEVKDG